MAELSSFQHELAALDRRLQQLSAAPDAPAMLVWRDDFDLAARHFLDNQTAFEELADNPTLSWAASNRLTKRIDTAIQCHTGEIVAASEQLRRIDIAANLTAALLQFKAETKRVRRANTRLDDELHAAIADAIQETEQENSADSASSHTSTASDTTSAKPVDSDRPFSTASISTPPQATAYLAANYIERV